MSARTAARARRRAAALLGVLLPLGLVVGCTDDAPGLPTPAPPTESSSAPSGPAAITFGVYGSADEVAGYDAVVRTFNAGSDTAEVSVVTARNHDEAMAGFASGEPLPDVFLLSRQDLGVLQGTGRIQPVDELLDARGIDFGDGYSRDALRAFSLDNRLVCMPWGISPMVIYYNTELIDFERMRLRGLPATTSDRFWNFEQFTAAAEFATRPRRETRGISIDATLQGLIPFIVAGEGNVFDDDVEPTSLALSEESTREALETTLALLRNAQLTLTPEQLEAAPALDYFKEGRLGMIAGFRDLVPELRRVQGLEFDVFSFPVLETTGTVGDVTGMCISADSPNIPEAADFLAHALEEESVSAVTRSGYLVPANVAVATSDTFLQTGRLPENSRTFIVAVRDIYFPPLISEWDELEAAIAPGIEELITTPLLPPETIEEITTAIDEQSQLILAPETESPSPSEE